MTSLDRKQYALQRITPNGPMADHALRALASIARTDCPVLMLGEHGAGKRTAAIEIQTLSARSHEPFHELHCRDLDAQTAQEMLESNGTNYLSEASDLTSGLQTLLIQDYFLSSRPWKCRLLFGSSRELQDEVKEGRMREDLHLLISTITVRISPLRLRRAEVLTLSDELLSQYSRQFGRAKPTLGEEITAYLMEYNWPDNFAELQMAMKTVAAIGDSVISLAALKAAAGSSRAKADRGNLSLKKATRQASLAVERQMISRVLGSTRGNRKRAATELGISYKALLYKIKQLDLDTHTNQDRFGVPV